MKTQYEASSGKNGVALVIVLGLLSVLTILAVAFAVAMRVERLAARNAAHAVRAEHLTQVALIRAVKELNEDMQGDPSGGKPGKVYPDWWVMGSGEGGGRWASETPSLLSGEAARAIPAAIRPGAPGAPSDDECKAHWIDVKSNVGGQEVNHGRVGYLVVNASGLLDPNHVSGAAQSFRTNINEIDISCLEEFDGNEEKAEKFLEEREDLHRRYETVSEITVNSGIVAEEIASFIPYSLDIDRDQYFEIDDIDDLGTPYAPDSLQAKFWINKIKNFDIWQSDANDLEKYVKAIQKGGEFKSYVTDLYVHVANALSKSDMPERADDVTWNFLNWLDQDKVPQSGMYIDAQRSGDKVVGASFRKHNINDPWAHTEGGEGLPLINEIVLAQLEPEEEDETVYRYQFTIELWYPFSGVDAEVEDDFRLQIGVWDNNPGAYHRERSKDLSQLDPDWKQYDEQNRPFGVPVGKMRYGAASEFRMFVSEEIVVNEAIESNSVYMLARVVYTKADSEPLIPVDQAGGCGGAFAEKQFPQNSVGTYSPHKKSYEPIEYATVGCWEVDDPRSNGKWTNWGGYNRDENEREGATWPGGLRDFRTPRPPGEHTLNSMNKRCLPWPVIAAGKWRQGLPIYVTNGLMRTIGEVGYIYRSNISGQDGTWDTIDLMHPDKGAYLLDHLTVRDTNAPPATKGLVCINSKQADTLKALFHNMEFGWTSASSPKRPKLKASHVDTVVNALMERSDPDSGRLIRQFRDIFIDPQTDQAYGNPDTEDAVRLGFYQAAINASLDLNSQRQMNDKDLEDPFRQIVDMITFRQNIFNIICIAQVYAPAEKVVVAEKRALATVYRDSYTGHTFTRSFKWLTDE